MTNTMTVVTGVKLTKFDTHEITIDHILPIIDNIAVGNCVVDPSECYTCETIRGRVFVNKKQEHICIGMSDEIQQFIGLPFIALEDQNRRIKKMCVSLIRDSKTIRKLNGIIAEQEAFGFWAHIAKAFASLKRKK